ncbi:hypothetical protein TrRE_jg7633 [Triparma retinervis]|uniref:Glycosyltransferase n=1 Tax=Triparma retinervis TaxID=2557542 RepID=A0A9W6Z9U0_9STRA|nr:hypothetical protein TrRE_jg7633 [Triparma retinervis]
MRECSGHGSYRIETIAGFEAGKKSVRWSVRRGEEELHRTHPISTTPPSLSPPEDAKFSFRLVTWEGGVDEYCEDVASRSGGLDVMGGALLGAGETTVFPHGCVRQLLADLGEECRWKSLRASLLFGEWSFEAARSVLDDRGCAGEVGWEGAKAILEALLTAGKTMRGYGGGLPEGEGFLMKIKTTKSVASQKQLASLLEIVAHQHPGSDVKMALAQELILAGHAELAGLHTMGLLDSGGVKEFGDFCLKSPLETTARGKEREVYFVMRQCLQRYVPTTLRSGEEAIAMREGLLELLRTWNEKLVASGGSQLNCMEPHADIGIRHVFLVVYQGLQGDDEVYGEMVKLHRNLCPQLLNWVDVRGKGGGEGGRVRVGLISNNLRFHSVGRLLRGVFGRLSREDFELVVLVGEGSTAREGGAIFEEITERADRVVALKEKVRDCQELLSSLELDVLVFGDIGMDAKTSYLAYGRYSKIQVAFWGHPVTTGLDSIDYFIGGEHFGEFSSDFSEQLVELGGSGVFWVDGGGEGGGGGGGGRGATLERILGRGEIRGNKKVYVCPQSVMKLHPKFDGAIREIVRRDDDALVVLLTDTRKVLWGERVVDRLGDLEEQGKVVFVEQLPYEEYLRLVCSADVSLDPFPFGGGVTMLESLGCGVPIVTEIDELKVFHLGNAWLELSGLGSLGGEGGYVKRAVALADIMAGSRRVETVRMISDAVKTTLFEDSGAVVEWEQFLKRVADAEIGE